MAFEGLGPTIGPVVVLLAMLVVYVLVKAVAIYATARLFGAADLAALRRTVMFAQGGEFAFVLYTAALTGAVIDARENAIFSTVVILFMAITPLIRAGVDFEIRETVESALLMGAEGLRRLGWDEAAVTEALEDIRRRDAQRLTEQVQGDIVSGRDKMLTAPVPEPLTACQTPSN